MKNITKSLIAFLSIMAVSCNIDDVEDRPVVTPIDAPVLMAPEDNNSYVLAIENASMQAERFVWSSANYDEDVAINYTIQIDNAGNDFANPQDLGSVIGGNQLSVSVQTLNDKVIALGGEPFTNAQYQVRIKASLNDTYEPMYSNSVTISVTPYVAVIPDLFLVGAPQQHYGLGQWDNTTAMAMRYIGDGITKVYEAYVKVGVGEGLKFIGEQGSWDNGNYGTIGGAQDGNLENSGGSGDLKIADVDGDGLYYVKVNLDDMTYKAVKMNWGVIGSATAGGWGSETAMTYNFASNTYVLSTTLNDGELKFRSSNTGNAIGGGDWQFNVGVSNPTVVYDQSSGNFSITNGTYNLELTINFDGTAVVGGL
jgi:hypothetical protein